MSRYITSILLLLNLHLLAADTKTDYVSIYSNKQQEFDKLPITSLVYINGKYGLSFSTNDFLKVDKFKLFVPNFVTFSIISTTLTGSKGMLEGFIASGKLPDDTIAKVHENGADNTTFFPKLTSGNTVYKVISTTIRYDTFIPSDIYTDKLGKWIYFKMIPDGVANYIKLNQGLNFDKIAVDNYVDTNGLSHPDCDNLPQEKQNIKKFCIYVRTLNLDDTGTTLSKPTITSQNANTASIKACEVGNNKFSATGGSGSYTWTSSNTYTGTINSSTGVLDYKTKAVGKFPTKIRAKDTKGTESDEFNFTLNVTKNLDLKQSADPIKINPNTPLDYNLSELIICEASGNTPEKWSYNITDSAEKNVSQGNSNRVNFTPTSEGNYTIHVNADGKKTSLKLLVTQLKMPFFKNPLDDINGTVSVKLEKDLNTFLSQGTPNKWSLLLPVSDATVSESGIFTWTNPVAGDYNLTVKAEDSTGQIASGTIKVHIDPLMIYGVPMSSILVNKPYSYTFTSLSGVGTSLQVNFFTSSLLTQGWSFRNGTMTWKNPVAGKYKFTVFANTEGTTNTVSRDFNITVNNPIHIDKINLSDRNTTCRANDPYLMVQDDGNLSISLKDATDNLSWNIKTSPTSTINSPIKNGDLYKSSLANLTPGSDRTDYVIDVNVTSTENRSSDKKQQKVMVVVDKNYLGLLDSKAKNVTDNSSYSVRKGEKLSFKPLGFGGPTCSMTYTPNDGSVSINNNCEITFNNVASYNVKLTVKKNDECASGATNITRSFSVNVTQGNIVPVLMYLLN